MRVQAGTGVGVKGWGFGGVVRWEEGVKGVCVCEALGRKVGGPRLQKLEGVCNGRGFD